MKLAPFAAMASIIFALGAGAQQPTAQQDTTPATNAVATSMQKLVTTMAKNIVAGAEEMPADKYDFRPTPGQNTFGHLVVHMIQANYFLCSTISGVDLPKAAQQSKDADPKDSLTAALKTSFDFCNDSMSKFGDAKLEEQVSMGGRGTAPRGYFVVTMAEDYGDHYAQESEYLRAAGLLPPTAMQKPGR